MTERSVRKMMIDFTRNDWSTRRLRERAEAEEFAESEKRERKARRQREQQRRRVTVSSAQHTALDQRLMALEEDKEVFTEAVAGFGATIREQVRAEFRAKDKELAAKIAELEKQFDARQSKAKNFQFARARGDGGERGLPLRSVRKVH